MTERLNWTDWSSRFPYFLQFKSEFGNKEFMIWALRRTKASITENFEISSTRATYVCALLTCYIWLFKPWIIAHQSPLSMEFSKQGYWRGLPFLHQGIFSTQWLNLWLLCLLHWQVDSLPRHHLGSQLIGIKNLKHILNSSYRNIKPTLNDYISCYHPKHHVRLIEKLWGAQKTKENITVLR